MNEFDEKEIRISDTAADQLVSGASLEQTQKTAGEQPGLHEETAGVQPGLHEETAGVQSGLHEETAGVQPGLQAEQKEAAQPDAEQVQLSAGCPPLLARRVLSGGEQAYFSSGLQSPAESVASGGSQTRTAEGAYAPCASRQERRGVLEQKQTAEEAQQLKPASDLPDRQNPEEKRPQQTAEQPVYSWMQNRQSGQNAGQPQYWQGGQNAGQPQYWQGGQNAGQPQNRQGGQNAGQPQYRQGGQNAGQPQNRQGGQNAGQPQNRQDGQNAGQPQNRQGGQNAGQPQYRQSGLNAGQSGPDYNRNGNSFRQDPGMQQNGPQYQQTAWNSQPHYHYYQRQQAQPNRQHAAKQTGGSGAGRRWGTVVAMALVFGLIAGTATYGVNRAANALFPAQTQTGDEVESAAGTDNNEAHLSVTGSESGESAQVQAAPADGTKTVAQVASECMPALVTISTMSVQEMRSFFGTQQYEAQGAGTGVIVGENDTELLIATNNHVIEGAQEVSIGFIDESVSEAQIKGTDAENDLAVVAVKLEDIPDETMDQIKIVAIGDSDELVLGDQVVAIGNALGVGQSVTSGYVSALDRELDLSDGFTNFTSTGLIQTDAAINSGNSGGALLNMKGELIGINEAKSAYTSSGVTVDNVGYAIPMSKAQPILEELMNQVTRERYSEDEQGYLGVSLVNVSQESTELYGIPQGVGFAEVAEGSPAAEAGAMKGDILTEFNGKEMNSVDEVMNEIKYYRSGEQVELTVLRADSGEYKEVKLTVTLGTKEAISSLQTQ